MEKWTVASDNDNADNDDGGGGGGGGIHLKMPNYLMCVRVSELERQFCFYPCFRSSSMDTMANGNIWCDFCVIRVENEKFS